MRVGQMVRTLLPDSLQRKVPPRQHAGRWPSRSHPRKVLLLEGCVQPSMAPNINPATARVLDALSIETLLPAAAGCCGAIRYHLSDHDGGLADARRNVDAWWPYVQHAEEDGIDAILMNASGCGVQVKEYGYLPRAILIRGRPAVTEMKNAFLNSAVLSQSYKRKSSGQRNGSVSSACTLQHGNKFAAQSKIPSQHCAEVAPSPEDMAAAPVGSTLLQPAVDYQLPTQARALQL